MDNIELKNQSIEPFNNGGQDEKMLTRSAYFRLFFKDGYLKAIAPQRLKDSFWIDEATSYLKLKI